MITRPTSYSGLFPFFNIFEYLGTPIRRSSSPSPLISTTSIEYPKLSCENDPQTFSFPYQGYTDCCYWFCRPKRVSVEPCSWFECISSWLQASNLFIRKVKSIIIPSKETNTTSFTVVLIHIIGSIIDYEFRTTELDTFDIWTRTQVSILCISKVVSTFCFFWVIRDFIGLSDNCFLGQLGQRWPSLEIILKLTWVFNNFIFFDQI